MITIIQALIVIFALFAWSRALLRQKSNNITIGELVFWSFIWISVIAIAIFPTTFNSLSIFLGSYNILNLAVYVSITLLLYLVYRLYVKLGTQQTEITMLVRETAINNHKRQKRK